MFALNLPTRSGERSMPSVLRASASTWTVGEGLILSRDCMLRVDVATDVLGHGRNVRCARGSVTWCTLQRMHGSSYSGVVCV